MIALEPAFLLCAVGVTTALLWRSRAPARLVLAGLLLGGCAAIGGKLLGGLFLSLRWLCYAIFVGGPALLLLDARANGRRVSLVLALGLAAVGLDAFVIEPRWLRVTALTVTSPKLQREHRIALVADLQTDALGPYERDALAQALAWEPELVLFAGDYLQIEDDAAYEAMIPAFRALLRDAGLAGPGAPRSYAVRGNMEWRPGWETLFNGTGVIATGDTTTYPAEELSITALSFSDSFGQRPPPDAPGFQIVFGHGPDFALDAPHGDLLLAGHTHGGQVRLPGLGPLLTMSSVPRAWAWGLTQTRADQALYVSAGVGMERNRAPRLRFLCRPELVLITLSPGPAFSARAGL